jgi:TolB-like protein/Flp pilus assembly protein TadD
LLLEFASVVDAVRCAVEVQHEMMERNADVPANRRIEFRMGINVGDIIKDGRDIYGDGVNVAARLEALAEPGGICISRMVRDQIRDKLPYPLDDLGEQSVKNIARPIRAYALHPRAVTDSPALSVLPVTPISPPARAPRLSIVVLPFTNLSSDPEQQYFADGITEDLTAELSRIADMLVISRNTAFTFRNKPVDTKQIGRELGVRFVLEGSVRRSGNQIRINTELIDAEADSHVWADRFDGDTSDLFAVQDEITSRIAVALNLELIGAEAARPTENPDALDYILLGRAANAKPPSARKYVETISFFERALALDPHSVEAQCRLAGALAGRLLEDLSESPTADIERAESLSRQALAVSPRSPLAHYARGQVLRAQQRFQEAIAEYETVVAFNRNSVSALSHLGWCKLLAGAIGEAIPLQEQAIRLSHRDPYIGISYFRIGVAHLLQSRIDEAISWFEKARSANPGHPVPHAYLASAHALKGDTELAAAELAEARTLSRDDRYSSIARLNARPYCGVPKVRALFEETYFAGLRKAGLRDG